MDYTYWALVSLVFVRFVSNILNVLAVAAISLTCALLVCPCFDPSFAGDWLYAEAMLERFIVEPPRTDFAGLLMLCWSTANYASACLLGSPIESLIPRASLVFFSLRYAFNFSSSSKCWVYSNPLFNVALYFS